MFFSHPAFKERLLLMSQAYYDDIASWYDSYLNENAIYQEVVLPTLLELVGDIQEQVICDLACGQGWLTRELARKGARLTGIDISEQLLALARSHEEREPLGITYVQGDAQDFDSFEANTFDGCVCIWSLVDIPDLPAVFQTIRYLLKRGGWLIFAITHPCFEPPGARWITGDDGRAARVVSSYFVERFWKSESGGVRSRVGVYHRMLSTYINNLVAAGFVLEKIIEPMATGERVRQVAGSQEIPSLMFVQARALL
jgi:2-polyprenyl-3-methyl-5-hydroxy-6-metoxy-1,4-benzoquinol methylase